MEWYNALILGIIQGLTEFLPISSSGHLVVASHFMNVENTLGFDVAVHVGTLFSVLIYYRKRLLSFFKPPFDAIKRLIVATIPAALVMLLFRNEIEKTFSVSFVPIGFMVSAILLFVLDYLRGDKEPTYKSSLVAGLFQAFAVLPGISRSGSTIFGSRLLGVERTEAVDFSFLMSIPVIFGSGVVALFDQSVQIEVTSCSIGLITSFAFGLLAIKLTVAAVKKAKTKFFALYLALLSIGLTVYNFVS